MDNYEPLFAVFLGFLFIFVVITGIKTIRSYYYYKASFYTEIYSGFFEFLVRKGNLKKMSQSYWLENQFGYHRIMFQVTQTRKTLLPYIVIILPSGLYIIQLYNESAKYVCNGTKLKKIIENEGSDNSVVNLPSPLKEFDLFQTEFENIVKASFSNVNYLCAFTDNSKIEGTLDDVITIKKSELINTLLKLHQDSNEELDESIIDLVYKRFLLQNK